MTHQVRYLALALALCLFPGSALAQGGAVAADAKELAAYRLTMETVKKVQVATRAMAAALKSDPKFQQKVKLQAEIDALRKKDELTDAEQERLTALEAEKEAIEESMDVNLGSATSLDEMEAAARRVPIVARSLEQAGIAPRDYAKFMMAMIQASMVAGFKKAGMLKEIPKDVNPENVKFVEEHEAELKAMTAEFEKLSKGGDTPRVW